MEVLMEINRPEIIDQKYSHRVRKDFNYFNMGDVSPEDMELTFEIVQKARYLLTEACKKNGRTGVILAITKTDTDTPILLVRIGKIDRSDPNYGGYEGGRETKYADFAASKAQFLKYNRSKSRSSENLDSHVILLGSQTRIKRETVPGGAVAFDNNFILSVSGLSSNWVVDENAVLEIGASLGFREKESIT